MDGYGKIPPQNIDLEEAVLAAIMIEDCIAEVSAILKPDNFYKPSHKDTFSACLKLQASGNPIDVLTLKEQLQSMGRLEACGGVMFLIGLTNKIGSSANVEYHAKLVKESWVKRQLIANSNEIIESAYDDTSDCFELMERSQLGLDNVFTEMNAMESKDFSSVLERQIEEIQLAALSPETIKKNVLGLPTGIYSLDRKILGFNSPDMIIAAARPGGGKTSFSLQAALTNLERGIPVGFISIEMTMEQLNLKLLSIKTGISVGRLRIKNLSRNEVLLIDKIKNEMKKYPFYVYDKPCDPDQIKGIFKTWKKKYGIQLGVLDYLQRVKVPKYMRGQGSDAQMTVVSNAIKDTCLSLEIPILALSQMSREIENRGGDKSRPQLTDLRVSGSLEQDADIVIFIYRPEMHKIFSYSDGSSTKGVTEFIVEKSRLESLGTIKAKFLASQGKFDDSGFEDFNAKEMPEDSETQLSLVAGDDDLPF